MELLMKPEMAQEVYIPEEEEIAKPNMNKKGEKPTRKAKGKSPSDALPGSDHGGSGHQHHRAVATTRPLNARQRREVLFSALSQGWPALASSGHQKPGPDTCPQGSKKAAAAWF